MAEATTRLTSRSTEDSTQKGCTTWLLLSCIVLTLTTAFVFGWGLGAPNMYNQYTEPFLKGSDPCLVDTAAKSHAANDVAMPETSAETVPPQPAVNENVANTDEEAPEDVNEDYIRAELDENGDDIVDAEAEKTAVLAPVKGAFDFVAELIKGIPQTIFLIGAFLGAVTGPVWSNLFDRKRTVFANYIFCFASSLCVLLAYYFAQPWLFYLSRFLLGYQGGMACVIVPPFIGEISSQKVRGAAGAAFQLSLTIGILMAQVVGLPFIAGNCHGWGWGLSIVFLLPLFGIFLLYLLPNSPTQLLGKYNDEAQAIADLKKLRGTENVDADIKLIQDQTRESSGSKSESLSIPQVLKSKRYRWPMLVTVALQLAQALSGVNAVFFYSSKMFAKAGIPNEYIPYANIGTGVINVAATIVSLFLIEKLGRRVLIIYPMAAMVAVFAGLTALVEINERQNSPTLGILTVVLILIFVVCFAIGLGPIPFLYGTEVCRPEARDSVQSIGLVSNYLGNILLSLFFPALNSILGGYVFLIFLVLVLLNVIFFWFKMPETMNTKLDVIEKFWNKEPISEEAVALKQQP